MSGKIPESGSVRFEMLWEPNEDVVVQLGVLADKTLTTYLFEADRYWIKQAVDHIRDLRSSVIDLETAGNELAACLEETINVATIEDLSREDHRRFQSKIFAWWRAVKGERQ